MTFVVRHPEIKAIKYDRSNIMDVVHFISPLAGAMLADSTTEPHDLIIIYEDICVKVLEDDYVVKIDNRFATFNADQFESLYKHIKNQ